MIDLYTHYPRFVAAIKQDHVEQDAEHGHGFLHACEVANLGYIIADDERMRLLVWVAGLLHNSDRMFEVSSEGLVELMKRRITCSDLHFTTTETGMVVEAVMEHSKRNSASDDAVTVALKDADRLANAGAGVLIRAGQFRPKDPVIDLEYAFKPDPTATFREPKTQLRNLQHILEWEDWLRLPKAKEIGKRRFAFIRMSIEQLFDDLREAELLPAKISGGFYTEDFKRDQEFDPRN